MVAGIFTWLLRPGRKSVTSSLMPPAVLLDDMRGAIYAVGDVHGCLDLLIDMESAIARDPVPEEKTIVLLGDFVDRGPKSAHVIDYLTAKKASGIRRICLMGNHERMMLSFLDAPSHASPWLRHGGAETLLSYGVDLENQGAATRNIGHMRALLDSHIPGEHIEFLRGLPFMAEGANTLYVHAGINPDAPLGAQDEADLTLTSGEFYKTREKFEKLVIHGHRVVEQATHFGNRVDVDTGAYATGLLSCARIRNGAMDAILETTMSGSVISAYGTSPGKTHS